MFTNGCLTPPTLLEMAIYHHLTGEFRVPEAQESNDESRGVALIGNFPEMGNIIGELQRLLKFLVCANNHGKFPVWIEENCTGAIPYAPEKP